MCSDQWGKGSLDFALRTPQTRLGITRDYQNRQKHRASVFSESKKMSNTSSEQCKKFRVHKMVLQYAPRTIDGDKAVDACTMSKPALAAVPSSQTSTLRKSQTQLEFDRDKAVSDQQSSEFRICQNDAPAPIYFSKRRTRVPIKVGLSKEPKISTEQNREFVKCRNDLQTAASAAVSFDELQAQVPIELDHVEVDLSKSPKTSNERGKEFEEPTQPSTSLKFQEQLEFDHDKTDVCTTPNASSQKGGEFKLYQNTVRVPVYFPKLSIQALIEAGLPKAAKTNAERNREFRKRQNSLPDSARADVSPNELETQAPIEVDDVKVNLSTTLKTSSERGTEFSVLQKTLLNAASTQLQPSTSLKFQAQVPRSSTERVKKYRARQKVLQNAAYTTVSATEPQPLTSLKFQAQEEVDHGKVDVYTGPKTSNERAKEFRARKKALQNTAHAVVSHTEPQPHTSLKLEAKVEVEYDKEDVYTVPRTSTERVKKFRARKKALRNTAHAAVLSTEPQPFASLNFQTKVEVDHDKPNAYTTPRTSTERVKKFRARKKALQNAVCTTVSSTEPQPSTSLQLQTQEEVDYEKAPKTSNEHIKKFRARQKALRNAVHEAVSSLEPQLSTSLKFQAVMEVDRIVEDLFSRLDYFQHGYSLDSKSDAFKSDESSSESEYETEFESESEYESEYDSPLTSEFSSDFDEEDEVPTPARIAHHLANMFGTQPRIIAPRKDNFQKQERSASVDTSTLNRTAFGCSHGMGCVCKLRYTAPLSDEYHCSSLSGKRIRPSTEPHSNLDCDQPHKFLRYSSAQRDHLYSTQAMERNFRSRLSQKDSQTHRADEQCQTLQVPSPNTPDKDNTLEPSSDVESIESLDIEFNECIDGDHTRPSESLVVLGDPGEFLDSNIVIEEPISNNFANCYNMDDSQECNDTFPILPHPVGSLEKERQQLTSAENNSFTIKCELDETDVDNGELNRSVEDVPFDALQFVNVKMECDETDICIASSEPVIKDEPSVPNKDSGLSGIVIKSEPVDPVDNDENNVPLSENKYVVYESCLRELLRHCIQCGATVPNPSFNNQQSMLRVTMICTKGHRTVWQSQPEFPFHCTNTFEKQ